VKKILALLVALAATPAVAQQPVYQSGFISPGHGAQWLTNGVIGDSGAPSGGVGLVGSFVINDMLCASATGTSISVIDCGFSATGTNNWVGLQNLNGGATAPTRPANDSTTNVATTAFVQNFGAAPANVMNFGAKCDGSTDDTTAIQTVLNTYKYVLIPAGCKVSTVTVGAAFLGQTLVGSGSGVSFLTSSSTTADIIQVAATSYGAIIRDFGIRRSVTASAGCGIHYLGYVDVPEIVNMEIQQQYVGLCLSSTGYGILRNSFIHNNISDNWTISNPTINNQYQWYLDTVLGESSGGRCSTVTAPPTAALGATVTMGTWTNVFCFANTGKGNAFLGNSSVGIYGVRIIGGFHGTDGDVEDYFDTYSGGIQINGLFTEQTASNSCIQFTSNVSDATLTGVVARSCSAAGIASAATTMLNLTGGALITNGTYGLVNTGIANLTGVEFNANTAGTVSNSGTFTGRSNSPASVDTLLGLAQGGTNANLSATGGTSQVLKQVSTGGAVTVGQLQCTDLSTAGTACTANTGTSGATLPLLNGNNAFSGQNVFTGQLIANGPVPTLTGSCVVVAGTQTGGSTAGKFAVPAGNCATTTTVILAMPTAPTGWACDAHDLTTPTSIFDQTGTESTTSVTFTIRSANASAADVIKFKCQGY
jgi:hypothetical protein